MNIIERKKVTTALLQEKLLKDKKLTEEKNKNLTEIVELRGQLALLNELELEEQKAKQPREKETTDTVNNTVDETK